MLHTLLIKAKRQLNVLDHTICYRCRRLICRMLKSDLIFLSIPVKTNRYFANI